MLRFRALDVSYCQRERGETMKGWGWVILIIIVGNAIINHSPLAFAILLFSAVTCFLAAGSHKRTSAEDMLKDIEKQDWTEQEPKKTMVAGVRPRRPAAEPAVSPAVRHEERKRSAEETLRSVDRMEGREFEAWCADVLRKLGYQNVSMTATTGDQGVDITAEKNGTKYAIQCKRYASDLGNRPVQEVYAGKAMYGCKVGVVMTNQYFTPGARDLAKATGTKLWDRGRLITMLQQIAKEQDERAAG